MCVRLLCVVGEWIVSLFTLCIQYNCVRRYECHSNDFLIVCSLQPPTIQVDVTDPDTGHFKGVLGGNLTPRCMYIIPSILFCVSHVHIHLDALTTPMHSSHTYHPDALITHIPPRCTHHTRITHTTHITHISHITHITHISHTYHISHTTHHTHITHHR